MLKYCAIIAISLLISCNHSKIEYNFFIPDKNDINEIIKTIVRHDSAFIKSELVSADLRKLKTVAHHQKSGELYVPPPPDYYKIEIGDLLRFKTGHQQNCFSKQDSLYILFQNDTLKTFRIDSSSFRHIRLTTGAEQEQKEKKGNSKRYMDMSIPIFSLNQKKAYVQINNFCPGCGSGYAVFLEKKMGQWQIVAQHRTWIN